MSLPCTVPTLAVNPYSTPIIIHMSSAIVVRGLLNVRYFRDVRSAYRANRASHASGIFRSSTSTYAA
jgi:hypothetical protein